MNTQQLLWHLSRALQKSSTLSIRRIEEIMALLLGSVFYGWIHYIYQYRASFHPYYFAEFLRTKSYSRTTIDVDIDCEHVLYVAKYLVQVHQNEAQGRYARQCKPARSVYVNELVFRKRNNKKRRPIRAIHIWFDLWG